MAEADEKSAYESLNRRHKRFADALAQGRVQWKAYRDYVYEGERKDSYAALASAASRLVATDVNIRRAIEERAGLYQMSQAEAIKRIGDLARATVEHFVKDGLHGGLEIDLTTDEAKAHLALLKEIKQKRRILLSSEDEESQILEVETEIKLHDVLASLDKILRVYKTYVDRIEIEGEIHVRGFNFGRPHTNGAASKEDRYLQP